jgi:hypothetical protein
VLKLMEVCNSMLFSETANLKYVMRIKITLSIGICSHQTQHFVVSISAYKATCFCLRGPSSGIKH